MKTTIVILLILLVFCNCIAVAQKSIFVRVYDLKGRKIFRRNVFTITDSSLSLIGKKTPVNIPVSVIGSIKTKHSAGNNILIGSIVGTSIGGIPGAASANPDPNPNEFQIGPQTAGEGAVAGIIVGAPIGAAIGGLTSVFKNVDIFSVGGGPAKWKDFQSFVSGKNGNEK